MFFFIGDIVPYIAGDSATVVTVSNPSNLIAWDNDTAWVSRNRANTSSWVPARIATLCMPTSGNQSPPWYNAQRLAQGDGNTYLWPWVVIEDGAGLRGRINKCFFAGVQIQGSAPSNSSFDAPPSLYQRLIYNSENYMLIAPMRGPIVTSQVVRTPFGWHPNGVMSSNYPVLAVPIP
jgi:hypothetical protein